MADPSGPASGVSRLVADPSLLGVGNRRLGLLTNFTGTMPDLGRNVDALLAARFDVVALFAPEHGLWGSAQAGASEPGGVDERTGLPVFDTYGRSGAALDEQVRAAGIDALLVDLRDVGVRVYTYIWSMFDLLLAAARRRLPVVVLDRPNPLAALPAQGPGLEPACASFVGRANIPFLHGLTIGELARRFAAVELADLSGRSGPPVEVGVVRLAGWGRGSGPGTVDPWVAPSPNLPTPASVLAYAATCLFEGTTASEGRGTTRPFELVGAGFADARLAAALRDRDLPGVLFRDVRFVPTFGKWSGAQVRGVQLHVVAPERYRPIVTGLTMLRVMAELYPGDFRFLEPAGGSTRPAIDLLWGSDVLRRDVRAEPEEILAGSPAPQPTPPGALLYPPGRGRHA